jgi:hypothetical protein
LSPITSILFSLFSFRIKFFFCYLVFYETEEPVEVRSDSASETGRVSTWKSQGATGKNVEGTTAPESGPNCHALLQGKAILAPPTSTSKTRFFISK